MDINKLALAASLFLLTQSNKHTTNTYRNSDRQDSTTITILGPSGEDTLLAETPIQITPNESVFDASVKALKASNLPFKASGSGLTGYMVSINNLSQRDKGPTSGWLYKVNDIFPSEGPGAYKLKKGDKITWVYTVNLGKDVGAPPVLFQGRNEKLINNLMMNENMTNEKTATISIVGPGGEEVILEKTSIPLSNEMSVLDFSKNALSNNGIPFIPMNEDSNGHIICIRGIAERAYGPNSGWLYKVNDTFPSEGPARYKIKAGDEITWIYTMNLGQDIGAPEDIFQGKNNQIANRFA